MRSTFILASLLVLAGCGNKDDGKGAPRDKARRSVRADSGKGSS